MTDPDHPDASVADPDPTAAVEPIRAPAEPPPTNSPQPAGLEPTAGAAPQPAGPEPAAVAGPTGFAALGVIPAITTALSDAGITEPFPIQELAIPIALTGTDVIGQARTGTGKTLAFGVPLLQRIVSPDDRDFADLEAPGAPQALVVAPTRELALQVAEDLVTAARRRAARVVTVYGGVGYEPQLTALATGVEVVVGTPGRLLDLVDRGALQLSHVRLLVLDEADRMLDLGFLPDVERLIAHTHEMRQTMLFSATMPGDIVTLARRHMRHPVNVRAEAAWEQQTVPATAQFVYRAHQLDKPELLARILQAENCTRTIVFCVTRRTTQRVADDLADRGFNVAAIHGDLGQPAREKALERFRAGKVDVLVATEVASRGIDVVAVSHVVNYTCPDDADAYLHRIGRTGRAGASGVAVTLVDWPDVTRWRTINHALDLPYPDPAETYSSSPQLYSDLGIPHGVTGKVGPPRGGPHRPPDAGPNGHRGRRDGAPSRSGAGRGSSGGGRRRGGAARHDERDRGEAAALRDEGAAAVARSSGHGEQRRSQRRRRTRRGRPVERTAADASRAERPAGS